MAILVHPNSGWQTVAAGDTNWNAASIVFNTVIYEATVAAGDVKLETKGGTGVSSMASIAPAAAFGVTCPANSHITLAVSGTGNIVLTGPVQPGSPVQFPAGTALLPSMTSAGDLDTGGWFPGGDIFAISTAGLEALRVNTAQQVVLTSALATTLLKIDNTGGDGDPTLAFALSGTQTFTMGVDDGDSDKFKIGTTTIGTNTRLTIDASGNVGIGTAAPEVGFHYEGASALFKNGDAGIVSSAEVTIESSGITVLQLLANAANSIRINFGDDASLTSGQISYDHVADRMNFVAGGVVVGYWEVGLVVGSPTGADKGAGTINATAVYDDGSGPLTDFVFDLAYDGAMSSKDKLEYPQGRLWSLNETEQFIQEHRHLPTLPSRTDFEKDRQPLGKMFLGLLEAIEHQQLQLVALAKRMDAND